MYIWVSTASKSWLNNNIFFNADSPIINGLKLTISRIEEGRVSIGKIVLEKNNNIEPIETEAMLAVSPLLNI